jgi:dephospho-CoA kinase
MEVDSVWVVTCGSADQSRRLTESRQLTATEVEARIAAQPPQQDKLPFADVVIDNSGPLEATREQVISAWEHCLSARISP